jgi:flagellar motor protein MotB
MDEENILDFNFWPSFSDLMLSLVLILVLVLFLVSAVLNVGTVNLSHVEKNQLELIQSIEEKFEVKSHKGKSDRDKSSYVISLSSKSEGDIFITNEPIIQKITFSSHILFPPDEVELNESGKRILSYIGRVLSENIRFIREIQIQGHADIDPSSYGSNMKLAAMRAISVFNFLKDEIDIDPAYHLMSISSFGEYKPIQRSEDFIYYDRSYLKKHNLTTEMKEKNRRIELLLFYRYEEK